MAAKKTYDTEYKVQAVKLGREIGFSKAARELNVNADTLYGWNRAAKDAKLDLGPGSQTPESAISLTQEIQMLRKQNRELAKENNRLKEENEFLAEASAFSLRAVGSQQKAENAVYLHEDRRRPDQGKDCILLPLPGRDQAGVLLVSQASRRSMEIQRNRRKDAGNRGRGRV